MQPPCGMDAFFLSLFLPFGQENDFGAKAFSRACQAALGLEQFSLTHSMKPRQQNKRWQWGFTLNPRLQNHPCSSAAEPLLHCRGSMKNSLTFACWKHPTVRKKLQKTKKKKKFAKQSALKLSMMCPCMVCVSCQLFLRLTDILAYKFN